MAAGCIVISNNTPIVVALLKDIGLVPKEHIAGNVEEFNALMIDWCTKDTTRYETIKKQRDYLLNYTQEQFKNGWLKIFNKVNKGFYKR